MSGILDGASSYLGSFAIIRKYKLWKYVLLSGIVSVVLGVIIFYTVWNSADSVGDWISGFYKWDFGRSFIERILDYLAGGLMLVISFLLYKYVIMVIVSPFMSMMSESIERQTSNVYSPQSFSITKMIRDLLRGLRIAISNLIRELSLTLLILLVGLFPIMTVVSPILLFAVQSYYAGFGNIDYFLERHTNVRTSRQFVKRHKGFAIGNGAVFLLILLIPIVGLFMAPALATVAATTEAMKRHEHAYS